MPDIDQEKADIAQIVESSNDFAIALYSKLAKEVPGNLFFSPSSIMAALAMTFAGADGETAREMADVLHFTLPADRLHEAFRQLRQSTRTGGVELRIANRLWGQRGYHFLPEFLETTDRCYGARLADVDFRGAAEVAREQINKWIEDQTAQKIKDLIPPGMLDSMTRLVLTNAVYFLGCWEHEFAEAATKDAPFWITPHDQHAVSMMHQTERFVYGESDGLQSLGMPYRKSKTEFRRSKAGSVEVSEDTNIDSDLAMFIVLPRRIDGITEIEARLSPSTLQQWTTLDSRRVEIRIPKLRIDSAFMSGTTLGSMGMRKAFSREADFSRMSDDPEGLCVSEVIHKAFVDVNEKGTEAAAATAVVMRALSASRPEEPKVFGADHPFLFLIRDQETRLIHFIGRLTDPR